MAGVGRKSAQIIGVAATVLTVLLLGGLIYGAHAILTTTGSGLKPSPVQEQGKSTAASTIAPTSARPHRFHVVTLGDSLAYGLGDASGRGFAGDLKNQLARAKRLASFVNLGISGLTSSGLLQQLKQPEVQRVARSANLILLSIGGNDLRVAMNPTTLSLTGIQSSTERFDQNFHAILSQMRTLNPHSPILIIGLYNPYLGEVEHPQPLTDALLVFNEHEEAIAAEFTNVVVVRTFDLFSLHPANWLYLDHFHPNEAGYARIEERIWQDIQGE